jgi:acyl-CoA synthetase (NDP forming)
VTDLRQSIASFVTPNSVAIIGASDNPARIGGRPIAYLLQAGYAGRILPVNPTRSEVQGLECFASIAAVPGEVDCALIVLPAEKVVAAARECAASGVRSVLVFSSGFAEIGEAGIAAQNELSQIAAETGMRIVGPNIVGAFHAVNRSFLTFSGAVAPAIGVTPSTVALVSQSGGYAGYILALAQERGLAFGSWITTGNEADVDVAEVVDFLADDPGTRIILAYVEGVKRGDIFMRGLAKARAAGKPVVVLKVGRTRLGAQAAASHTASLAGSDEVFDTVCRQFGAHRARSAEEMIEIARAALKGNLPAGNRLGVMTVSGGVGVQIADLAEEYGLTMPSVPASAQAMLSQIVPFAATRNPVDITAQFTNDPTIINRSLDVMFETDCYDAVVLFLGHAASFPSLAGHFVATVSEVRRKHPDRLLAICALGSPEILSRYEGAGCLVFQGPEPAIATLAALHRLNAPGPAHAQATPTIAPPWGGATRKLNEYEGKRLLAQYGISVPPETLAQTPQEARAAAERLGCLVALKIASADIPHKSEVGGVALDLASPDQVEQAATAMLRDIPVRQPGARIEGLIVAPMIGGGTECIVGLHRDPAFGPVIMFGLGGVAVELLRDVTFRVGRIDVAEALAMIRETRCFPLLGGFRGRPRCDLDALAQALADLSAALADPGSAILAAEINPLLVRQDGAGVVALDAVVEVSGSGD